jgi:hypothetical protein
VPGSAARTTDTALRLTTALLLSIGLALPFHCGAPSPRSSATFDQIQQQVRGKTAAEIEALLGRPDTRQRLATEEKWIWWNYTVLDGEQYAPEVRRQIVHLEIVFDCASGAGDAAVARAACRVDDPLAVSYSRPGRPD